MLRLVHDAVTEPNFLELPLEDPLFHRVAAQRQRAVAAHHLERFWRGFRFAAAFGDATDAAALFVVVEKLIWHRFNHRATMIEQNGAVVRVLSRRH